MKVATVIGTRPEVIKMSPLLEELEKNFNSIVIHTGQHYDPAMDSQIFDELRISQPKFRLKTGSGNFAKQVSLIMNGLYNVLSSEQPDLVIVQGDTNSALCGALVAARLKIKVIHVEAGCRSYNLESPEEQNRIIIDSISSFRFCPDRISFSNLLREGKKTSSYNFGSTTFDAINRSLKFSPKDFYKKFLVKKNKFVVATLHRAENVDNDSFIKKINYLNWLSDYIPIIFPVHPRTRQVLKKRGIQMSQNIFQSEPLNHLPFINLLRNCRFVVSDSGGIQEEAAYLNKPCLVLRNETEWTRFIKVKKNFLLPELGTKDYALSLRLIHDDSFYERTCKIPNPESEGGSTKRMMGVLKTLSQKL